MNVKEYAEALLKLPEDFLQADVEKEFCEAHFHERLYVMTMNTMTMWHDGKWQTPQ